METPTIKIEGRTIMPRPPKMRVWREFLAFFDEDKTDMGIEEYLDRQADLIVLGFNQPEVTKTAIDEYVDVGDVVPLARQLFKWIQSLTFSKLMKLPNGTAGKD